MNGEGFAFFRRCATRNTLARFGRSRVYCFGGWQCECCRLEWRGRPEFYQFEHFLRRPEVRPWEL